MGARYATAVAMVFLAGSPAWALTSTGSEFRVNAYTTANQINPSVAALPDSDGEFMVVWESDGQDESRLGVFAATFSASGAADSAEFQVTEYTTRDQKNVDVAGLSGGDFVAVWASDSRGPADTGDTSSFGIFGQIFDTDGIPLLEEDFRANTYTQGEQNYPRVAGLDDGFVVIWESAAQDGSALGIFGQRFDEDGERVGTEFQANTYTTDDQRTAAVVGHPDGGFVIAWTSDPAGATGQDQSGAGVFAQRYTAAGARAGAEFQLNSITTGQQVRPAVASLSDGAFMAVWESRSLESATSTSDGVAARVASASGTFAAAEIQVNTYTTNFQEDTSVAALPFGEVLVVWESQGGNAGRTTGGDTDDSGVFARRLSRAGAAQGSEFQVNSYTTNEQDDPRVVALDDERFVVVWESTAQDGSGGGIFAQIYTSDLECGDPNGDGTVTSSDALQILKVAIGSGECPLCVCDVDGNGDIRAADALIALRASTSTSDELDCDAC